MCCHQETECCSTTTSSQKEKPSTEKSVPLAGVDYQQIGAFPFHVGMASCYGFVTEILVASEDAVREAASLLAVEERLSLFLQEQPSEGGLAEALRRSLLTLLSISQTATELEAALFRVVASVGTLTQTDSSCQCARMKGKSLG